MHFLLRVVWNIQSRTQLFPTKQTQRSASVPFPITQNCFDIAWNKVKQCPLREWLGGKSPKLGSVRGMLIYLETESGDVVIKDSISQRSVWFNRTLPLTDGVFLTSALQRFACHKHYSKTRHLAEIKHPAQSWGLTQTRRTVFKWLWRSIRLLIYVMSLQKQEERPASARSSNNNVLKGCQAGLSSWSRNSFHALSQHVSQWGSRLFF